MTTDLRVGLVGFGWVNREVWFPRLLQHRNCQVVAVCDPAFTGQRPDPLDGVAVVDRPAALVEHGLCAPCEPGSRPVELTAHLSGTSSEAVEAGAKWRADEGGTGPIDVETDGELRAVYPDGSSLSLRAAWVSDTPVDTTRISVRGTDAEGAPYRAELLTTFGFSPHRVTCPVLRVERAGQHHEWHAGTVPGQEYDDQLEAAVAMVRRRAPWRTELLGTASVMALFEEAYRVAGRPLLPEGEAEPVGVRRC